MPSATDIVVFGVASNGSVLQWDGHPTPTGILLHWFVRPDLGYPPLGFDLYRAQVPDTPPLPFNDLNVPFVEGKPDWSYADVLKLSCSNGLRFERTAQPGWWQLIVTPTSPVSVRFTSPAWLVSIKADADSSGLIVTGRNNGVVISRQELTQSGETIAWRTRGIDSMELSGTGTVSFIGYHLLDHQASWNKIAHRCLPVIDPGYRCGPQQRVSEADEAKSRLPTRVAAEWSRRFADSFADLLPALRRLAIGAPPGQIPQDTTREMRISGDERELIKLAALDPHGARILGLAYDDLFNGGLDGNEYVYKVVGQWLGAKVKQEFKPGRKSGFDLLAQRHGIVLDRKATRSGSGITLKFPNTVLDFLIELDASIGLEWTSDDGNGGADSGRLPIGPAQLRLARLRELRMVWRSTAPPPLLSSVQWTPLIERIGLLPGIKAVEPGAPSGPTALDVSIVPAASSSMITLAGLDWPMNVSPNGSIPEGEPVSYQIGHRYLGAGTATPYPLPDPAKQDDLLYKGAPVFISSAAATQAGAGRVLHTDRNEGAGLDPGLWAWWVRGVDLFGRVSLPSPWKLAPVVDTSPSAAPMMVQAEWVQRNMPDATVAVIRRSVAARRWLQNSSADNGLVASWAFGPDQANQRQDVDGFQLLVRKPQNAGAGTPLQYPDAWSQPIASFGPMPIRATGTVTSSPAIDPALAVSITSVRQSAAPANAGLNDPIRSVCTTTLELDGGSGVFVGGTLRLGATSYSISANGDGPNLSVVVTHAAGAAPGIGTAQLRAPAGTLVELNTDLPALNPGGNLLAGSGVLQLKNATQEHRLQVLRNDGGVFLCRAAAIAPASGDVAMWYPVWTASLGDTGFGPDANVTTPVAHAQVAVRAVRAIQTAGISSAASAPLTVTAVDLTVPVSPELNAIPFDPALQCAQLASRADWYGKSRFRVIWSAQADRRFLVYRALGDEINRLDRIEHDRDAGRAHSFPDASLWPAGVHADLDRRARVLAELSALDAARAIADTNADTDWEPSARDVAVEAAYDAMTIDTQMLLARQAYAWPAYIALTTEPIDAHEYEDVLDGRTRGHWFYRITSRTHAGAESVPSDPTPPICCPDVVAPSPPVAHMALADALGNGVKLRWLTSPDADTARYEIYSAQQPEAIADLARMVPVAVHAPSVHVGGALINFRVARVPGDWCFWIVAVDTSENRSTPSAMLRGKSLKPAPAPPVWVSAERAPAGAPTHIGLTWSHPNDQRLACLVERRPIAGGYWAAVSAWLPRGVYNYEDTPSNLNVGWEYRLRVRDHLGQVALILPAMTLEALIDA